MSNTFKLNKRKANITNLNTRTETHGDINVPAFDVSVTVPVKEKEIEDLIRAPEGFLDALYEGDNLVLPDLFPASIYRKPDNLRVTITDDEGDMVFKKAKAKSLVLALEEKRRGTLSLKFQFAINPEDDADADEHIARLAYLQKAEGSIKVVSEQPDFFEGEEEEETNE